MRPSIQFLGGLLKLGFRFFLLAFWFCSPLHADVFFNPIISDGADPWVIYKDNFYYYTHTTGLEVKIRKAARITGNLGVGNATAVTVFTPTLPYNQGVWAPELHFLQGKWYIYFAADDGNNANHRMYVAEAVLPDPQGPYTSKGKIFDAANDRWAIDGTVLEKSDGSLYFIWSGWPGSVDGKQNLYIAPMSNPWTISGPRVLISTPTYGWEGWIHEGPQVIKRNGKIFIVYSANASWMDDYCFGLLANTDGDVLNPSSWTKNPTPVFQKFSDANGGVYGPGHGSFTKSVDQTEDWLFYHAAKFSGAGWNRNVRVQKFTWNPDDSPNFGNPIPTSVALTVPSGEGTPTPPVGDYTLTVNTTSGGSVTKNPDQSSYAPNSTVTLTALPDVGSYFYSWAGDASGANNPLTVTMDRNKTITAVFTNEIVLDNSAAIFVGAWTTASSATDKYGSDYRYAGTANTVTRTATFTPTISATAKYDVYVWHPQGGNRSAAAPFLVSYLNGSVTANVNQQTGGGSWQLIASGKKFEQGTNGFVRLANNTGEAGKLVMADAVRFVYSANQDLPPTFITQPQNQSVVAGSNVTFSVSATGSQPLAFQWRLNGAAIPGATATNYFISNVQPGAAGDYSVVASNSFGMTTSVDARLTVFVPPTITTQPQSQTVNRTESVTFFVEVSGSAPFGYQWRFNSNNIAGANQASYTISSAETTDAGNYSVVVSNGAGSVTSSNATLTVNILPGGTAPTITRQPADQTVIQGANATFSVEASGVSLSYQWRFNATNISGATANAYTQTNSQPTNAGNYSVVVSNPFGSATSSNAALTVLVPPTILDQPLSQVVVRDANVSFSVSASGTQPLNYQWKFNGAVISGATISSYSRSNVQVDDAGIYSVMVSNVAGAATSSNANLTVNVPPDIDVQPLSQTVNLGANVLFSVGASGTHPLSYQWRWNGTNIPSATTSAYTIVESQASDAGNYSVVVTNVAGSETSLDAVLAFNFPPTITTPPQSQTNIVGATVSFSVSVSGTSPFSYQWQKNGNDLIDGGNISGATSSTLTLSNISETDAADYNVLVTNVAGFELSDVVALVVSVVPPVITLPPQNQTVNLGAEANFYVSATGSQPLNYQWRFKNSDIVSATGSSFTLLNAQGIDVGAYSVVVSNSAAVAVSSGALLFVTGVETNLPTVAIISPKSNERITNNLNITMTGVAKDTGLGVAQVFYKLNESAFQTASGTTNWSAALALVPGTNQVEVKAVDLGTNESVIVKRTFFGVVPSLFTLSTNGIGSILSTPSTLGTPTNGAMLEVGRSYKIQAVPALTKIFSNWSGTVTYTNALFTFIMQSNMTLTANIVPNPLLQTAGKYNGLFFETNVTHQTAGFFHMNVKMNFTFSGKLVFDGDTISTSGKFDVDGTMTKILSRAKQGKSDLTLALALDFANGTDKATGTVSEISWTADLEADRATFSVINPPTAYTNRHTMLLPGFADSIDGPPGYGYGLVTVSSNGSVKLSGATGDGMTLSQSVPISKNGLWPLYVPIYKSVRIHTNLLKNVLATNKSYKLGSVLGWVTFTNNAPTGTVSWIKTGWTNAVYPNGFTNESELLGSRYLVPTIGNRAIAIINGTITLTNGNLSSEITRNLFVNTNNALTITPTNQIVKLSLTAKTGLLNGSFQHPDNTNKVTAIKGAVLQEQNFGGGFFVVTNESGLLLLEEN